VRGLAPEKALKKSGRRACRMKLDQVDTESRVLHMARLKGRLSTTQPLRVGARRLFCLPFSHRAGVAALFLVAFYRSDPQAN
jgi:hypothetical protein